MGRPAFFLIPGDINLPTGGYGYDRQVLAHADAAGFDLRYVGLPGGYPQPDDAVLDETRRIVAGLPADGVLVIDGLALGAIPAALIRDFARPVIELCHHPLALEPGLSDDQIAAFKASEHAALDHCDAIIVTAPRTAEIVTEMFGVAPDRIAVAEPGTLPAPRAKGSGRTAPRLVAVGSIIPRKGYDVLVNAMAALKNLDWTLDIAGAMQFDAAHVAQMRDAIVKNGLEDRVHLLGALNAGELDRLYDQADLFVMSSYFEGYGMVIAEALARGLPIVSTTGGALGDTMPDAAGLKVPPGDPKLLGDAVARMLASADVRRFYAEQSWIAGQSLPRWTDTVRRIKSVVETI